MKADLRGVFRLGDSPEGGDEKLKTEKLTIWLSIGAPEDGTLETGHLWSTSVSGGQPRGSHHRGASGVTSGSPKGHLRVTSAESPEGRLRGRLKEASSSAGAAWEPDFQIFSFLHPFIYI